MRSDDFRRCEQCRGRSRRKRGRRLRHAGRRARPRYRHDHHSSAWSAGCFGIDPSVLINGAQILSGGGSTMQQTSPAPPVTAGTPTDATRKFVASVLGDTEDRWTEIFTAAGKTYHPPRLRLFSRRRTDGGLRAWRSRPWGRSTVRSDKRHLSGYVVLRGYAGQIRRLLERQRLPIFRGLCDRA